MLRRQTGVDLKAAKEAIEASPEYLSSVAPSGQVARSRGGIWWLASYPKSGNTWLRAILATLMSGKPVDINAMAFLGPHATSRSHFDRALGVDSTSLSYEQELNLRPRVYEILAADAERPLYCKTHDAYLATPAQPGIMIGVLHELLDRTRIDKAVRQERGQHDG